MRESPIGREAVWRRLVSRLESRRSGLVLIAGQPGSGRTHLLHAVGDAARDLGFTVIGSDEPVAIDPTTKLSDVHRILAAILSGGSGASAAPPVSMAGGVIRRMYNRAVESMRDERAVLELLDRAAPAVLIIDGFVPSVTLLPWFARRLIPHVLASTDPVIVIIADRPEPMAALSDLAADVIKIGPLDRDAVVRYLREIGVGLRPPLSDEEVTAYYHAVTEDVGLFSPLAEVLSVLAEDNGKTVGRTQGPAPVAAAHPQEGR